MNFILSNPIQGKSRITTEHSASSYGIPVLVNEDGEVFGPADIIGGGADDPLAWTLDGPLTARQLVERYGLAERDPLESAGHYAERIEASKLFLGGITHANT